MDLSGVRVARTVVYVYCFVDRCLLFCPFSFGHCVVFDSSIYDHICERLCNSEQFMKAQTYDLVFPLEGISTSKMEVI
jgi:hypothetical protein